MNCWTVLLINRMRQTLLLTGLLVACIAGVSPVAAQDCAPRGPAMPGTLANPQAPCHTATRQPLQPSSGRTAPAQQGERGVFRHGNTTVRMGGAVSTDVTVRGR